MVGDAVGLAVGVLVGCLVGCLVGEAVGFAVGAVVVGCAVGCFVGETVGFAVGAVVGLLVGFGVTTGMICAVGAGEGAPVGRRVGAAVGAGVGWRVKEGNVMFTLAEAMHVGPRPTRSDACAVAVTGNEISAPLQTLAVIVSCTCVEPPSPKMRPMFDKSRLRLGVLPITDCSAESIPPLFIIV